MLAGNIRLKDGDDCSERLRWSFRTEIIKHGRNLGFGCSSDRFCHYFFANFISNEKMKNIGRCKKMVIDMLIGKWINSV